jgi:hypothetical protein
MFAIAILESPDLVFNVNDLDSTPSYRPILGPWVNELAIASVQGRHTNRFADPSSVDPYISLLTLATVVVNPKTTNP